MEAYEQVFQGDIWVMRLPDDMIIEKENELPRLHGKLIVQEGEMTGHHHYVDTLERTPDTASDDVDFSALHSASIKGMFTKQSMPTAKFFSAVKTAEKLVREEVLLRADLIVGLLDIENGPMNLYHQEHNSVGLSPGKYLVGRQIESVAGEERRVAD